MTWCLHILGTNSAAPTKDRNPSAQLLTTEKHSFLIDCGEGAQKQMLAMGLKKSRINQIFISHLHGDHVFGLPGLLTSFNLNGRSTPLTIHGPRGTHEFIHGLIELLHLRFTFAIQVTDHDHQTPEILYESEDIEVSSIPLSHRIPTIGFLFRERISSRKMIKGMIEKYEISYPSIPGIKDGGDWVMPSGEIIANQVLTQPNRRPYSYAYCSDTLYCPEMVDHIRGIEILYHEATFLHDRLTDATDKMHSTAHQAAQIAKAAEVTLLLLGHFSARYDDLNDFQVEAAAVFEYVAIAKDGQQWDFKKMRSEHI